LLLISLSGIQFLFKLTSDSSDGDMSTHVRLIDSKRRQYTDIPADEFTLLYNEIIEIYQNSPKPADGVGQLENAVYGGKFTWRKCLAGRHSNLFTTALLNSMANKSSIADQSFRSPIRSSRRSVISEVLGWPVLGSGKISRRIKYP